MTHLLHAFILLLLRDEFLARLDGGLQVGLEFLVFVCEGLKVLLGGGICHSYSIPVWATIKRYLG